MYHYLVGGCLEMRDLGFCFNGESAHLDCEAFLYILYMHVDCIILLSYLKVNLTYASQLNFFGE